MQFEIIKEFVNWRDIVDIVGLTLLFYFFIRFLSLAKGLYLLRILLVLGLLWTLAEVLGLSTLSWIFERFWVLILFALVVIFQPEIRRTLASIGRRTRVLGIKEYEERSIDRLVRACRFMAERQIGALIVIEREENIEDLLEGCIYIDAYISAELIITIFYPLTPLHDGAIVIRNDRIAYASCVLPLSKNPELPRKYGTRHRAAVGITEMSDAVAIVVSEETGEISIAVEGTLEKVLDPELLKDKLLSLLGVKHES
ncbi:MAG: TIGR00159 family protein [Aquificae bacterium]|nr:TIGR00159 family protein [Aquificota bacterium]